MKDLGFKLPIPDADPEGRGPRLYTKYRSVQFAQPVTPCPTPLLEALLRAPLYENCISKIEAHYSPRMVDTGGEGSVRGTYARNKALRLLIKDFGEFVKTTFGVTKRSPLKPPPPPAQLPSPSTPPATAGDLAQELHSTKAELRRVKRELDQLKAAQTSGRVGETVGTGGSQQASAERPSGQPRKGETPEQTILRLRLQRDDLLKQLPLSEEAVDRYLTAAKGMAALVKDHITLLDTWEKRQFNSLEEYFNSVPRRQAEALDEYRQRVRIPEVSHPSHELSPRGSGSSSSHKGGPPSPKPKTTPPEAHGAKATTPGRESPEPPPKETGLKATFKIPEGYRPPAKAPPPDYMEEGSEAATLSQREETPKGEEEWEQFPEGFDEGALDLGSDPE